MKSRDRNSDSVPEPKKKDLSRIQCFRCDKYGHFARDCLSRPKHQAAAANVDGASSHKESCGNLEGFLF